MAPNIDAAADSVNNNFTMIDPGNNAFAGANDVHFSWDGTKKTSVAASGQVSNAKISSTCSFFGVPWKAHDVAVYSAGTYTVYSGCPAGSPGCGTGVPINFTVKKEEIGIHMLMDWNDDVDMDVVNVMKPKAASSNTWTVGCGSNSACTVWTWMSYDFDGDGVNGKPIVDGTWVGMNVNFNLGAGTVDLCCDAAARCNDKNICTTDTCNTATGVCGHTPLVCDDNNRCTTDTCNTATGCVYTPVVTTDNNACTNDVCDPAKGVISHTPIVCDDNNACTTDRCNPATGCVYTPIMCDDNNACTHDTCDPAYGCIFTPDNCPTDQTCDPATGKCAMAVPEGSFKGESLGEPLG